MTNKETKLVLIGFIAGAVICFFICKNHLDDALRKSSEKADTSVKIEAARIELMGAVYLTMPPIKIPEFPKPEFEVRHENKITVPMPPEMVDLMKKAVNQPQQLNFTPQPIRIYVPKELYFYFKESPEQLEKKLGELLPDPKPKVEFKVINEDENGKSERDATPEENERINKEMSQ